MSAKLHYDAEGNCGRPRTACGSGGDRTIEHDKVTCLQCRCTKVFLAGPRLTIDGSLRAAIARAERAEAEVQRLKGLLHSEVLCTMHYCERHEMAYQRPEHAQSGCPHCEAERAEAEVARLREVLAPFALAASLHGVRRVGRDDLWVSLGVASSAWVAAMRAAMRTVDAMLDEGER